MMFNDRNLCFWGFEMEEEVEVFLVFIHVLSMVIWWDKGVFSFLFFFSFVGLRIIRFDGFTRNLRTEFSPHCFCFLTFWFLLLSVHLFHLPPCNVFPPIYMAMAICGKGNKKSHNIIKYNSSGVFWSRLIIFFDLH